MGVVGRLDPPSVPVHLAADLHETLAIFQGAGTRQPELADCALLGLVSAAATVLSPVRTGLSLSSVRRIGVGSGRCEVEK